MFEGGGLKGVELQWSEAAPSSVALVAVYNLAANLLKPPLVSINPNQSQAFCWCRVFHCWLLTHIYMCISNLCLHISCEQNTVLLLYKLMQIKKSCAALFCGKLACNPLHHPIPIHYMCILTTSPSSYKRPAQMKHQHHQSYRPNKRKKVHPQNDETVKVQTFRYTFCTFCMMCRQF